MIKTKRLLPILLIIVIVSLLGTLLFGCKTSNEQERQITNAFTPGKTQVTANSAQPSEIIPTQTEPDGVTTETQPQPTSLPPDQPTMIVTNTQGLPIIVTQTRAATQPNQPVSTATPTTKPATSTATKTVTPSSTPTKTLTPTVTLQTGWAGEWKVFWQMDNNNYVDGTITVVVAGTNFTANGTLGGVDYTFLGSIIEQGLTAFGDWTSPTSTGNFIWTDIGAGQFGGSRDTYYGFCGARNSVIPPNPCYLSPLL